MAWMDAYECWEQNIFVVVGDWNLVMDQNLDTHGYLHRNNVGAQHRVMQMKTALSLVDPWRAMHENTRRYTWRASGGGLKQARLDFFIVSEDIYSLTKKTEILAGYKTDHSLIKLVLTLSKNEHGKGFWKFNCSLLRDDGC